MFKHFSFIFICAVMACSYTTPLTAETTKKFPYDIVNFIDEQLEEIKDRPYYDCVKDEIYAKLRERLTDEDLAAADYYGETNIEYIKTAVGVITKIGATISEVSYTSPCMPHKGEESQEEYQEESSLDF